MTVETFTPHPDRLPWFSDAEEFAIHYRNEILRAIDSNSPQKANHIISNMMHPVYQEKKDFADKIIQILEDIEI